MALGGCWLAGSASRIGAGSRVGLTIEPQQPPPVHIVPRTEMSRMFLRLVLSSDTILRLRAGAATQVEDCANGSGQRPVQRGVRLSMKADMPSCASAARAFM